LAGRDQVKAVAAISELQGSTGKEVHFLHLDLANLHSIQKAAKEFQTLVQACSNFFWKLMQFLPQQGEEA
jgi:short-subunit dehydrogenase